MKLLSDAQFDIRDYFGTLVIMYPEESGEIIAPLRQQLDISGHVYYCFALGPSLAYRGDYVNEIINALDRCACFMPIITDSLYEKKNLPYHAMLWHYIGYMKAKAQDSIVPFIPKGEKVTLAGTPIQELDVMNDFDVFFKTLAGKYSSRLICNNYYENRMTNFYAARRIGYHCLKLYFDVYEDAFQNAKNYYKEFTSHRINDSALDDMIRDQLICGCLVVSFGVEENLNPQMQLYKDEISPRVSDYTRSFSCRKSYRRLSEQDREKTGIRAKLSVDLIVPVHKLLGAYVKCYISSLEGEMPMGMLLALLEPDFREDNDISEYNPDDFDDSSFWKERYPIGTHIDERRARFYFELSAFKRPDNIAAPPENLGIGDRMDYIFPQ